MAALSMTDYDYILRELFAILFVFFVVYFLFLWILIKKIKRENV